MYKALFLLLQILLVAGCSTSRAGAEKKLTDEYYYTQFSHIPWQEIGRSVENRPIRKAVFGTGEDVTLFFSCFHGSERSTPRFGFEFANLLHKNPDLVAPDKQVVVVPLLNPDGFVHNTRNNANDTDLNRNYPTGNWGRQPGGQRVVDFGPTPASEPETRIVFKLHADHQPDKILSVHQPLKCNNNDGPNGLPLAELMAEHNGYEVKPYIGYPTPGSYGTYAGIELGIPMVTLELPRGMPDSKAFDQMWTENREALLAVVNCNLSELPPAK